MTKLYTELYQYGFQLKIDIPQIIVVKSITGIKALYGDDQKYIRAIVIGEKELSQENLSTEIIQIVKSCENKGDAPRNNMTILYIFGTMIAKSLKIKCPQIIIGEGESFVDSQLYCITIRPEQEIRDIIFFLAYHMRHAWQIEKHPHTYLSNYYTKEYFFDLGEFYLQKAEVDAFAYAGRFVNDVLKLSWSPKSEYPEVNQAIVEQGIKMRVQCPDILYCLPEGLEDAQVVGVIDLDFCQSFIDFCQCFT